MNPTAAIAANVPTMATGTAASGMIAARHALQEHQHDDGDEDDRVAQRLEHLVDRLADERRGVVADLVHDARREVLAHPRHRGLHRVGRLERVASGRMKIARPTVGLSSKRLDTSCDFGPEFDAGHVA